jgi:hypothetical protein
VLSEEELVELVEEELVDLELEDDVELLFVLIEDLEELD